MTRQYQVAIRAAATTVFGLAAIAAVLADVGAPLQPILVFWFVLVCPGTALVGLVRPASVSLGVAMSVSISCALAIGVAQVLLYAGAWSPVTALAILTVLTAVSGGADVLADRRARRLPVVAGRGAT